MSICILLLILAGGNQQSKPEPTINQHAGGQAEQLISQIRKYPTTYFVRTVPDEYEYLLEKAEDKPAVERGQQQWLAERDACTTEACIEKVYLERITEIRLKLAEIYKNLIQECFTDVKDAIWKRISLFDGLEERAPLFSQSTASFGDTAVDLDLDGQTDILLILREDFEPCMAGNCWRSGELFFKLDGCYVSSSVNLERAETYQPNDLPDRVYRAWKKGPFHPELGILSTYNVTGCAGASGGRNFTAFRTDTKEFEVFASIEYDCDEVIEFWTAYP